MTARDPFVARADEIGKRMGAAEFDLCVASVELEQIADEAIKLADRRDAAKELEADAWRRYRAAVDDFNALVRERDHEADERAAIEAEP